MVKDVASKLNSLSPAMSEAVNWWDTTEPAVKALARKIALRHGVDVDQLALPYENPRIDTATGTAFLAQAHSLRPVWTFYVTTARFALETRDDMRVDAALPGIFTDQDMPDTPDQTWRREAGLDGEADV